VGTVRQAQSARGFRFSTTIERVDVSLCETRITCRGCDFGRDFATGTSSIDVTRVLDALSAERAAAVPARTNVAGITSGVVTGVAARSGISR
jgi:hypothetical protein